MHDKSPRNEHEKNIDSDRSAPYGVCFYALLAVMHVCVQAGGEEAGEEGGEEAGEEGDDAQEEAREEAGEGGEEGGCEEEVREQSLLVLHCRQSTEFESVAL